MTTREPVDPATLPQKQPDPYEGVAVTDFSTAAQMDVQQMLTMADLAARQGLPGVSLRWKTVATEKVRQDEIKAAADKMLDSWQSHPMPPPGTPVIEVRPDTPWDHDTEYRNLEAEWRKAQSELDAADQTNPVIHQIRTKAANAREAMKAREEKIREELSATGAFTEQNQRVIDAQKTLAEKAAKVAEQVRR